MKKRLFCVLLALCIVLSILPSPALAAGPRKNGELAYNQLKMFIITSGEYSNGSYKYNYPLDNNRYFVLDYDPNNGDIGIVMISIGDEISTATGVTITPDLNMPYMALQIVTVNGYTEDSANAYILPSFTLNSSLVMANGEGDYLTDGFKTLFVTALSLGLSYTEHLCFNGTPFSIGDLGFTAYADDMGYEYDVTLVPSVTSGKLGKDVYWQLDDDVLYITGTGPMDNFMTYTLGTDTTSPLFAIRHFIRYVIIDQGVTSIGGYVFDHCSMMEEIYIPPSIEDINYYAFSYCSNLSYVDLPLGLKSIGDGAFCACDSLGGAYYHGNQSDWDKVSVGQYNEDLLFAPVYLNMHYPEKVDKVNPTCTKAGTEEYWECECGKIFSDEECEHEISAPVTIEALGHKWDSGKVTKKATETAEGVKTYTCERCGATKTESIPKLTPSPTPTPSPTVKNPFKEVKSGAYYYDPVLWAVSHDPQITNGTSATTFSPDQTCTRGQVVTFLWRAAGCPEPTSTKNPFKDVSKSDYFYKAVLWAVEQGITVGTSKTTFSPNAPCTRAHVVTFLYRSEGSPKASGSNPFKDVKSSDYFYAPVLWAVKNDITKGTDTSHFSPGSPCTRGQIVTFLYRDKT